MKKEIILGIIDSNGYEHGNRVYSIQGINPTLSARDFKDPIKIVDMKRGCHEDDQLSL